MDNVSLWRCVWAAAMTTNINTAPAITFLSFMMRNLEYF
jgi:hypothetical protein